ncbi:colon cancer-associated Mic1-like domain-containing protein [Heterostelium album PN500]|uniref:Colon cancer-associated Mic1-like domain-containing protein n=1 Tax=Heterostelium pallidum (strain ATCC 26659 / Pp 5 / PN500) TaxID=670386 RepID=D3AWH5_HETP5|nr:colon cancer-associated Mic1-like domain-containing protein [Heterostelium album PN500]EFA86648.1 colon cancer-associated Mic1-like domain-containing protein [Heterostelium album PN500]|eukprot:XP_020438753.1 colon cancer-associated Mic1-like domain-containing protein [Heterostelium album PN500]
MSVELRPIGLKIESNESFLSLDDNLGVVILANSSGFGYVPLSNSKERGYYCSDKPIKDAKFSPNGLYAATQFNDTDIEILNIHDGKRIIQNTRYKSTRGTVILSFYFISTKVDTLLIITNTSLELYQITSNQTEIQCKLVKDTKTKIHSFVFSPKTSTILTYGGTGNTIQPYRFTQSYIEKLARFTVDSSVPLDLSNLYMTILYGRNYCIFSDQNQMSFYELNNETVYRVQMIKFLMTGTNQIHIVDNIVIVHYNEHKVSMVYDLRMLKSPSNFPISAIPMTLFNSSSSSVTDLVNFHQQQQQSGQLTPRQNSQQQQQQHQLYLSSWRYVFPNYIFDSLSGHWYEVTLNFEKVSNFFQVDTDKIIPFLQLRSSPNAKIALLQHIKTIIEYKSEPLEVLGKIFDSLNHDLFTMTSRNNTQLIQQHLNMAAKKQSPAKPSSADDEDLIGDLNTRQQGLSTSTSNSNSNSPTLPPVVSSGSLNSSTSSATRFVPPPSNTQRTMTNGVSLSSSRGASTASSLKQSGSGLDLSSLDISSSQSTGGINGITHQVVSMRTRGPANILVNSDDLFEHVFNPIYDNLTQQIQTIKSSTTMSQADKESNLQRIEVDSRFLIAILTEYIRSLNYQYCGKSDKLFSLLLSLFIDNQMFSQLHRFLQYNVIEDSENIAYKLLSISETYPPALQLSLDMFKRLKMPNVIISTLLEKKQVLLALRFMRSTKTKYNVDEFLKHASLQGDDTLFFTVNKYRYKFKSKLFVQPKYYTFYFEFNFDNKPSNLFRFSHFNRNKKLLKISNNFSTTIETVSFEVPFISVEDSVLEISNTNISSKLNLFNSNISLSNNVNSESFILTLNQSRLNILDNNIIINNGQIDLYSSKINFNGKMNSVNNSSFLSINGDLAFRNTKIVFHDISYIEGNGSLTCGNNIEAKDYLYFGSFGETSKLLVDCDISSTKGLIFNIFVDSKTNFTQFSTKNVKFFSTSEVNLFINNNFSENITLFYFDDQSQFNLSKITIIEYNNIKYESGFSKSSTKLSLYFVEKTNSSTTGSDTSTTSVGTTGASSTTGMENITATNTPIIIYDLETKRPARPYLAMGIIFGSIGLILVMLGVGIYFIKYKGIFAYSDHAEAVNRTTSTDSFATLNSQGYKIKQFDI